MRNKITSVLIEVAMSLVDIIEALQQENEQLRAQLDEWKYEVKCHMDEVIAREKQIEQLRAQVARMRETLEKAREALKGVNVVRCPYCWGKETHSDKCEISKAIENIDKAIGGKEDEK